MKSVLITMTLLMSGAAIAQSTDEATTTDTADQVATVQTSPVADEAISQATPATVAPGQIVEPSNKRPERDAHGHKVISAAAMVPSGWNGLGGAAMGGPVPEEASYPACSAKVTDNCTQTYERGRKR